MIFPVFLCLLGVPFVPRLPDDRGHRFDNGPSIFFPDPLQVKRIFEQSTVVITQFVNNPTRGPMCPIFGGRRIFCRVAMPILAMPFLTRIERPSIPASKCRTSHFQQINSHILFSVA